MQSLTGQTRLTPFLKKNSELSELILGLNWGMTSIGNPDNWPQSLLTSLSIMSHSQFPMFLFWGLDNICFYNDAYRPSLGVTGKHPSILGTKGKEAWPEIWSFIGPMIESILRGGDATWFENQLVPIYRNGQLENVYWTFSYSAVIDERGKTGGVFVTCTETTDQLSHIQKMAEINEELVFTIDAAEMGIWDLNPGTGKFTSNARLKEWFGLNPDDEIPLPLAIEVVDEEDRQSVSAAISRSLEYDSGGAYHSIYTITNPKTGERRKVLAKGKTRFNDNKEPQRLNGTLQDITELEEAQKKLVKSQRHLELLSNTVPAMIFYLDAEQRYQTYNDTFMKWFAVGSSEAIGKTVREFLGEKAYARVNPYLQQAYAGEQVRYEMNAPSRIGEDAWLNIVYTPHKDDQGKVLGLIVHATNITESKLTEIALRESEARFRSLVEEAPVATCLFVGPEFRVEVANNIMLGYWGKGREVVGQNVAVAVPELVGQPFLDKLIEVYTKGITHHGSAEPAVLEVDGKSGESYFDYTYKPLFDTNGKVYAIMDMAVDVTAEVLARNKIEEIVKQRTTELAAANLALQHSNRELEQFAYVTSHDLQEPVRKVAVFTDMLREHLGTIDAKSENLLNRIVSASKKMMQLIHSVLDYSRLAATETAFQKLNLDELIYSLTVDFELMIEQENALIEYRDLPVISCDPVQIRQLFGNLLSNALKFRKKGMQPVITISSRYLTAAEQQRYSKENSAKYVEVIFNDNGIGFDDVYAKKIFNIFQRLHGKVDFEGTGIGLAICKKIARNHGGDIWANAEPGNGATFHVILPV